MEADPNEEFMVRVIQAQVDVGEDRVLRVPLPDDAPTGPVEVFVVIEARRERSAEERRAAARAGSGALRDLDFSTEAFLAERREDDRRRDRALGV